jgi:hypothetical protein
LTTITLVNDPVAILREARTRLGPIETAHAFGWLPVERLVDLYPERFRCKRFVQERDPRLEDPVVDDRFVRVP